MQEQQESGYHEAPQELLRGPPPVTTGRAPITTGAKLPSAYGHQTARVLHNPRPICTVFPSVHPLQVRTAGNGGAPALTLSCAPAIRGGYPSGNVHAEGHGNHGMQPSGSSPHYPQVVHGSRQSIDAQYFSGASPRYHSPQSGSSQQSAMAAHASSQSGQGQFAYDHPPPSRHGHHRQRQPPQRDNGMQQGYGDQRAPPHQPSLIEQYTGMHAPSQFIPQQAPQQLSARDLDLHADGAYPGPAVSSRKPPSSGVQPQQNPGGRFSLRVGRICEDSAEGLEDGFGRSSRMAGTSHPNRPPAGWLLGSNHDNCQSEAFELPQTNIFRPTSTPYGQARNAERSAPSGRGLQHIASLGPEILQDLDPPLPGMSRHMSHPAHSAQEVPSLDKSNSLSALDMRADRGPHRAGYRDPAAAQAPDGWLQEPAGLSSLPPEPGMLTDPPLCFSAEVPGGDRGEPPNPFAMSQHQSFGDDADWNSQGGTGSMSSARHTNTNGPFEPDFWQPIDVEAEQSRGGDGGDPWSSSLDGTASLQLADLYTWLDNALESRPEDPANPALQAPARRLAEAPTVPSSPKRISGPMSGYCSEPDELSGTNRSSHSGVSGAKHKSIPIGEPRQRSRRRLSLETNPFSDPADDEIISIPKSEMQAREEHQQRLQQQVEEKQQACKILAMQLQDAHRKNAGAHHDNANLPQPDERPRQVRATTPAVDRLSEGGYPE
ncbi:hypothetical protein WJX84_007430 [Apatococcus fuscideae]|uniref:Uncharacterized protein n=1 Tax=Apatococcus fuscideae TaxID=2026836 RepID=A0AAW1SU56_9CHLO